MKKTILSAAIASLALVSCGRDDSSETTNPSPAAVLSDLQAKALVTNANTMFTANATSQIDSRSALSADLGASGNISITGTLVDLMSGAKINRVTSGNTTTTTIDYGAGISVLGIQKSGKINIVSVGDLSSQNYTSTITYQAYGVSGNILNGTVSTKASNTNGQPVIATSKNTTLTLADGSGAVKVNGDFILAMTAGSSTPLNIFDDVWTETGNGSYSDPTGSYTVTSNANLAYKIGCGHALSGTQTFVNNGQTYSLNYGSGLCGSNASLTKPDGTTVSLALQINHK